jgi:hypothetical protein
VCGCRRIGRRGRGPAVPLSGYTAAEKKEKGMRQQGVVRAQEGWRPTCMASGLGRPWQRWQRCLLGTSPLVCKRPAGVAAE